MVSTVCPKAFTTWSASTSSNLMVSTVCPKAYHLECLGLIKPPNGEYSVSQGLPPGVPQPHQTSRLTTSSVLTSYGPIYTKRQHQCCDDSATMLATPFSLKTMELLENGLPPQSRATILFSMKTVSLASLHIGCSVDTEARRKSTY